MKTKLFNLVAIPQLMLFALLWVAFNVHAHQQKAAITTVLFNKRTGNIEVMHRFNMHDAEHAVKALFDGEADIIGDHKTQEKFAQYVIDRFSMMDSSGNALALRQVGFESEGKHFWVYQELPKPDSLEGLQVAHNALRDLWPTQVNTLNIEGQGRIRTLTFDENATLLEVRF